MSNDAYTISDVMKLSDRTRRQLDTVRLRLGPTLRPRKVGCMLLFDAHDVRVIMAELQRGRKKKEPTND